ncbi:MAG: ABC transporter permease [Bacteroidales bacterium]|jgi:ABC-2 type transport system permease protein|nr:ABC transporter permease [Bacteroidales bacterium]
MGNISTIIKREYTSRVKKKSFIIMTVLTPLIFVALFLVPVLIMGNQDKEFKKIAVIEDGSDLFKGVLKDRDDVDFEYLLDADVNQLKGTFEEAGYYGILYISPLVTNVPQAIQLISKKQPPMDLLQYIERTLEQDIENKKLLAYNIENLDEILKSVQTDVSVQTIRIDDAGETKETSTGISMALAYIGAFLMYMVVIMFGVQVMRGVFEEKNNRIVEVIISSVKPVELMMGKILGIALVGLTQFSVWIILSFAILTVVQSQVLPDDPKVMREQISQSVMNQAQAAMDNEDLMQSADFSAQEQEFAKIFNNLMNVNWPFILTSFFFYFIFGYLLYASVFAAIGSAVDTDTDTQQFMFPIMLPIILALFVAIGTMENPESSLSFWFSMIPFTSPIVMMARLPFEVPLWEVVVSIALLVATFVAFVYLAARIYRVGILMYGKKVTYKEMWKWIRYKG